MKHMLWIILVLINFVVNAATNTLNIYVWGGEIPKQLIQQFEKETGIHVNFATYDSNETMYAKLKASRTPLYDIILPSAYYVERMHKQDLLTRLDHHKLDQMVNLDPLFRNNAYDKGNYYSIPIIWGATGIFYNREWIHPPIDSWNDLWQARWKNQLLMLDDAREVFSMALLSLGMDPNDTNPEHIEKAYQHLLKLVPNIKLFASDSIQAIIIDEDARLGSVWNGDAFKAHKENPRIDFVFPKEGYVIWIDCLAIPRNAPHLQEAYRFINFMLRPEIAMQIAMIEGHAITNSKGKILLPESLRTNSMIYPPAAILTRGHFQRDVGDQTIALLNHYWEKLKLAL